MLTGRHLINWTYKIVNVMVDKGVDVSNPSNWKYVPATRISLKVHTFYGGVMQTHVTMTDAGEIVATKRHLIRNHILQNYL